MSGADLTFRAMGCEIRLIVGAPGPGGIDPAAAAADGRAFIEDFNRRLSRFRPGSELRTLNAHPADAAPASALLRTAVGAAMAAAAQTGGLVDPTLVDQIERLGYSSSHEGVAPADLRSALATAPSRRPAQPDPARRWALIDVDEPAGVIHRPRGVRLDSGGIGKGLAADLLATRLARQTRFVVSCGGDLRAGGTVAARHEMLVEHPLTGERDALLSIEGGAVATSGINSRLWRRADGRYAHHLIDPRTGEPAWTGLIGVTALAPTGVAAETAAKAALLSGPGRGRPLLAEHGGILFHESGEAEPVGPIDLRPNLTVRLPVAAQRGAAA